jgi:glycine cleavage system H protein
MSEYPEELRYTKEHEWVRVEGDRGRIGITHYAQNQLGDVVFVELPEAGRKLAAGESFGTVESVKAVSELYAPLAGEVVEANGALAKAPEAVNSDPYGAGWMIVVRLADASVVSGLLSAGQYRALVESEAR